MFSQACVIPTVHGGHAWQGEHGWQAACVAGGCAFQGVCTVGGGRGACMTGEGAWQERWSLKRAVHILLECIIVCKSSLLPWILYPDFDNCIINKMCDFQLLAAFLSVYEFRRGVHSSAVFLGFWTLEALLFIIPFRSLILHIKYEDGVSSFMLLTKLIQ